MSGTIEVPAVCEIVLTGLAAYILKASIATDGLISNGPSFVCLRKNGTSGSRGCISPGRIQYSAAGQAGNSICIHGLGGCTGYGASKLVNPETSPICINGTGAWDLGTENPIFRGRKGTEVVTARLLLIRDTEEPATLAFVDTIAKDVVTWVPRPGETSLGTGPATLTSTAECSGEILLAPSDSGTSTTTVDRVFLFSNAARATFVKNGTGAVILVAIVVATGDA